MPIKKMIITITGDTINILQELQLPPKKVHLKPSIMPTIGFKEYKNNHFLGMTVEVYATGEA